ncbi:hypothetical protein TEA_022155 [Camellia sinensis var. sinensis]|uniref:Uncharacterized protein n=1 Tax=Camellia sinensis var. sinensis TaxID=542762 RepID=A0A4S4EHF6_CAMSN|nr:hypothetical protein TEA_022155 [Camellia sinensis var. sinensis]
MVKLFLQHKPVMKLLKLCTWNSLGNQCSISGVFSALFYSTQTETETGTSSSSSRDTLYGRLLQFGNPRVSIVPMVEMCPYLAPSQSPVKLDIASSVPPVNGPIMNRQPISVGNITPTTVKVTANIGSTYRDINIESAAVFVALAPWHVQQQTNNTLTIIHSGIGMTKGGM